MAGIAVALNTPQDAEACKQFCQQVLSVRHWGPAEQRALCERLPLLMQRLYGWLGLPIAGIEEGLLRTFHPNGPLAAHLSAMTAPTFVYPLRRLPPRALRAAVLAAGGPDGFNPRSRTTIGRSFRLDGLGIPRSSDEAFGSPWFGLLGAGRLARSPDGGVEGVTLTAQEYVLTCLVHYLICVEPPMPISQTSGPGPGGPTGMPGGSAGAPYPGGFSGFQGAAQPAVGAPLSSSQPVGVSGGFGVGGGGFGAFPGGRAGPSQHVPPGTLRPSLDRILLAQLRAHLPHGQYELAYANEPRAARFLLHLLHEFLLAPQPSTEDLPPSLRADASVASLARAKPAALHALRLVAIHMLAHPALRRGCEEGQPTSGHGANARAVRLTREAALLNPPLVDLLIEILTALCDQKQAGLEMLTSLTKLWLILIQPWKARRLYNWYLEARPDGPRLEPPTQQGMGGIGFGAAAGPCNAGNKQNASLDVALEGLAPDVPFGAPDVPGPFLPGSFNSGADSSSSAPPSQADGRGMSGAASSSSAGPSRNNAVMAVPPLVPGDGDAMSWRGYVAKFHGAYCLLEAFLNAPLHAELCMQLCRGLAGVTTSTSAGAQSPGLFGSGQAAFPNDPPSAEPVLPNPVRLGVGLAGGWGGETPPAVAQLLKQRHVVAALRTFAQALLCFADSRLLSVIGSLPADSGGLGYPALPLLSGCGEGVCLRPEASLALSATWAALLAASSLPELRPVIATVSQQLQRTPQWAFAERPPTLEDPQMTHKAYAIRILGELAGQQQKQQQRVEYIPSSLFDVQLEGAAPVTMPAPRPQSTLADAIFVGSEWQRPVRGGEVEILIQVAYWSACSIDWMLGRQPKAITTGQVPQTEWPRAFANWKLSTSAVSALFVAVAMLW